jgi:hypothetical protein
MAKTPKNNNYKIDVKQYKISVQVRRTQSIKVIYNYCSMAMETLAFLYEMPKSHDLGYIRGYIIRILKLPKISKIDNIRLAVPHPTLYSYILIPKY